MNETIPYLPGLSPVAGKELCARFDGGRLSSDGGVLLFAGIERRLGIAELLASRVTDARDPASTTHSYADMIRARLFVAVVFKPGLSQSIEGFFCNSADATVFVLESQFKQLG